MAWCASCALRVTSDPSDADATLDSRADAALPDAFLTDVRDGAAESMTPDAARPDTSAMDAPVTPVPCRWSVGAPRALTSGSGVKIPRSLALAPDGVWIAWQGETDVSLQRVGFDGTPQAGPLPAPGGVHEGIPLIAARSDGLAFAG
jgi:hypothetical protein